jgi:SAM-dependent methyltransferase
MRYTYKPHGSACPVCKNQKSHVLYTVNSKEAALHFKTTGWHDPNDLNRFETLKQTIESLWNQNEGHVVECKACKFVYAHPYIAGNADFYNGAFDDGYPSEKWEFEQTLKSVKQQKHFPNLKILEVGSGIGFFLKHLLSLGISPSSIEATEYSKQGVKALKDLGVTVYEADIRALYANNVIKASDYDMIFVFQVMEHLDSLGEFMSVMQNLLKPGGNFYMAVPNPNRIRFNELNGGFLDIPPNHINRFSPQSLDILAKENGFKIINMQTEPEKLSSIMGSFFYQRSIRRLQLNQRSPSNIQAKIQFNLYRLKCWAKGLPGEGFWIHLQKK